MPEAATETPTPIPLVVSTEEFEARVPEAFRGQYVDDDGGKKKRILMEFGDDNPGALRNALARQKADLTKYKTDLDKYLALGSVDEIVPLLDKAKAPPPPTDGKVDDAALKAARDAFDAKERIWRTREAELNAEKTSLETRLREGHHDNEIANAVSLARPKPDSVMLLTQMLKAESRIEEEDGKLKTRMLERKDGELKIRWNGQGKEMTPLDRLEELRVNPAWSHLFEPSPANGTGAPPGRGASSGGGGYTPDQLSKMPMEEFARLSAEGKFKGL